MKRGDLYRVAKPSRRDPKKHRVFVVVSRQKVIDARFSTVICAPIYSKHGGLSTQVLVHIEKSLTHDSSIYCDELISILKSRLTNFVGRLSPEKIEELNQALRVALALDE